MHQSPKLLPSNQVIYHHLVSEQSETRTTYYPVKLQRRLEACEVGSGCSEVVSSVCNHSPTLKSVEYANQVLLLIHTLARNAFKERAPVLVRHWWFRSSPW